MRTHSRVIQVIETCYTKGDGTPDNPGRKVTAYFNFDGKLIYEHDEFLEDLKKSKINTEEVAANIRKEMGYLC